MARPLFKSRRKFSKLADLLLQGRCPIQALAAASMCTREQAATRHVSRGSVDTDGGGSSGRSSRGQDADKATVRTANAFEPFPSPSFLLHAPSEQLDNWLILSLNRRG
ncbi:hypothetical protein V6N13_117346 [Hibiscus sabdariffa]